MKTKGNVAAGGLTLVVEQVSHSVSSVARGESYVGARDC